MSSLGLRQVVRLRRRRLVATSSRSQSGSNCCQNASTEQYRSRILMTMPPDETDGALGNRIISRLKAFRLSKIHVMEQPYQVDYVLLCLG
jgi:hypothetical protein